MGSIYLVNGAGTRLRLVATDFESEDKFQQVVASIPDLLPGDQIDATNPRRWLLIDREVAIPDSDASAGRWSIDHLFIDQDSIPTLVEIKRRSDTRLRREVVGQMLDYAANAEAYWPEDLMREVYDARCAREGENPESKLREFLQGGTEPDRFWGLAQANLKAGKVRLVFLADAIPPELQRVVEFMNERMADTEVVAVEVGRYTGDGAEVYVPRVVGHSIGAQDKTRASEKRGTWDEESFFEHALICAGDAGMHAIRGLYDICLGHGLRIDWGTGTRHGSFNPKFPMPGNAGPFTVRCSGKLWYKGGWFDGDGASEPARLMKSLLDQYLVRAGIFTEAEIETGEPEIPLERWDGRVNELGAVIDDVLRGMNGA